MFVPPAVKKKSLLHLSDPFNQIMQFNDEIGVSNMTVFP